MISRNMFRSLLCVSLGVAAGASYAVNPLVIASTVAGSARQVVPGEPTLIWWANASSLGRVHGSPDGRLFAFAGLIDDPSDRKQAWCFGEVDQPSTWQTPFIEDRVWPLDNTRTIDDNRTAMGVADDGTIVFEGNASGVTSADDYILSYKNGVYTQLAAEGSTAPGAPFAYVTIMGGCSISNATGRRYYQSGANSATANGGLWLESDLISIRGVSQVDFNGSPITVNFYEPDRLRASDDLDVYLYQVRLNAATTEDSAVVIGTDVVAREGYTLPGDLSGLLVSSLDSANSCSNISPNGMYACFRGSYADTTDFAVFLKPKKFAGNFVDVVHEGDAVFANSAEAWYGGGAGTFGSNAFAIAAVNSFGDRLLGGYTDAALDQNYVLTLNGKLLMREGQAIDLDGNGQFDDDCFFNQAVADNVAFSENNRVLLGATVRNSVGTVTGITILAFDAPIPGDVDGDGEVGPNDFSLLSSSFGLVEGDPGYNPDADLDGDGEVGPSDFSILSTNFGRTR